MHVSLQVTILHCTWHCNIICCVIFSWPCPWLTSTLTNSFCLSQSSRAVMTRHSQLYWNEFFQVPWYDYRHGKNLLQYVFVWWFLTAGLEALRCEILLLTFFPTHGADRAALCNDWGAYANNKTSWTGGIEPVEMTDLWQVCAVKRHQWVFRGIFIQASVTGKRKIWIDAQKYSCMLPIVPAVCPTAMLAGRNQTWTGKC